MNKDYDDFALHNSDIADDPVIQHVIRDTCVNVLYPQMLTFPLQASLLRTISLMLKPSCVVEIGTFTGLGTICLASGLAENGIILTFEKNEELEDRILANFKKAGIETKTRLITGDALLNLSDIKQEIDLAYIDADKENYGKYFKMIFPLLKSGAWLIADNVWWDGKVISTAEKPSKETRGILSFLDACKTEKKAERLLLPLYDGLMIIRKK